MPVRALRPWDLRVPRGARECAAASAPRRTGAIGPSLLATRTASARVAPRPPGAARRAQEAGPRSGRSRRVSLASTRESSRRNGDPGLTAAGSRSPRFRSARRTLRPRMRIDRHSRACWACTLECTRRPCMRGPAHAARTRSGGSTRPARSPGRSRRRRRPLAQRHRWPGQRKGSRCRQTMTISCRGSAHCQRLREAGMQLGTSTMSLRRARERGRSGH